MGVHLERSRLRPDQKRCAGCLTVFPKTSEHFGPRKLKTGPGFSSYCRECDRRLNRSRWASRMDVIADLKDRPCADCGIKYPPYVMQFDHQGDKEFEISRGGYKNMEVVLAEIAKCDVVCANCHAERTHGHIWGLTHAYKVGGKNKP